MLFLKLTLLCLYVAAPALFVKADIMITCYGDIQHLHCDTGMIEVTSSVYGGKDSTLCKSNLLESQPSTPSCSSAITTIGDRCNGLQDCDLKTDLLGDHKPCYGLYKYYNTTYTCINAHLSVVCENSYSELDCGTNAIYILNSNYGRADSVTCAKGVPSRFLQNTNCYSPDARSVLSSLCNGKTKCSGQVITSVFTDSCPLTAKYLTVFYMCTTRSITCEGKTASLDCGAGRIKIASANYGRTDSTTCPSNVPSQVSNKNCYTSKTLSIVKASCDGQSTCSIPANNDIFSDPCPYTYKYLDIVYGCV